MGLSPCGSDRLAPRRKTKSPPLPCHPFSFAFFLRLCHNPPQRDTLDEAAAQWLEPDTGPTDVVRSQCVGWA